MKKFVLIFAAFILIMITGSCNKSSGNDTFGNNYAGPVHGSVAPDQLQNLFPDDSVGKPEKNTGLETQTSIRIYDKKNGEALLQLDYRNTGDSLTLFAVEILSPRYHSEKGPGRSSGFAEWKKAYKPGRVETTLQHVVVFVPELNATLTFGIDALAEAAQHNSAVKPDVDAIKPGAKPESVILFVK